MYLAGSGSLWNNIDLYVLLRQSVILCHLRCSVGTIEIRLPYPKKKKKTIETQMATQPVTMVTAFDNNIGLLHNRINN